MSDARRPIPFLALAFLLVASAAERSAYFSARMLFPLTLRQEQSLSVAEIGWAYTVLALVGAIALVVGGMVALAVGPRATAAGGALVAALGWLLVATKSGLYVGLGLGTIGAGIFAPCPLAAAAGLLRSDEEDDATSPSTHTVASVAAFASLLYGTIHLGAAIGPPAVGIAASADDPGAGYYLASTAAAVGAALAGVAALLARPTASGDPALRTHPYRHATRGPAATSPFWSRALGGLAVLAIGALLHNIGTAFAAPPAAMLRSAPWAHMVAGVVAILASFSLMGLLIAAAIARASWSPLIVFGAGVAVSGAGLLLLLVAPGDPPGDGAFAAGSGVVALGGTAVASIGATYASLVPHERARALAVGLWLLVTSRSAILTGLLGLRAGTVAFGIVGIACSVVGLLIAVRAGRLHDACFATMPAAPSHPT